jgi:hypothetical protein
MINFSFSGGYYSIHGFHSSSGMRGCAAPGIQLMVWELTLRVSSHTIN